MALTLAAPDLRAQTCGQPGMALEFDGIDDRVTIPHDASLSLPDYTVEAWARVNFPACLICVSIRST